ncbi:MAG: hypothetical protein IJ124_06905 [Clostridia bacterium]|nr:hypothetical protein [Clostridia bacterium]
MENGNSQKSGELRRLSPEELREVSGGTTRPNKAINLLCSKCRVRTQHSLTRKHRYICLICGTDNTPNDPMVQ